MAMDLFSFRQHCDKDPNRGGALQQAQSLRAAVIKYRQALQALNIQGLCLFKDDYYNLSRSEGNHTEEEAQQFAIAILKEGFHVRCLERNIIEDNQAKRRIIEHFFFCNEEQIFLACRFLSHFLLETDARFNINHLNMPLSVLLGITNTGSFFPAAYCFISLESKESSWFMFACMKELMFYDQCQRYSWGLAAGLGVAMVKAVNPQEMPGGEAKSTYKMSQAMDVSRTDCSWHAAEAIKKKLIKAGSYPLEIRKELTSRIWVWIQSFSLDLLEKNRQKLLQKLNPTESLCIEIYSFKNLVLNGCIGLSP
ncbi:hypothetical protein MMC31_004587 [Peltigera leucophlebia]|nr:hypothetical protein [Peltigera leucophlebia]